MELRMLKLREKVVVDKIVSFHYEELPKDYVEDVGLDYSFWQFLYVDKGEIELITEQTEFHLRQGGILFLPPHQLRRGRANPKIPPNLLIVSFDCRSSSLVRLKNKCFQVDDGKRNFLTQMIKEGRNTFDPSPLEKQKESIARRKNALFGCEHMVKNYMEILLISMIRESESHLPTGKLTSTQKEKQEKEIASRVVAHIDVHLQANLSLDNIVDAFSISRTQLYYIFKKEIGCGVTEYIIRKRIDKAKTYIREEKYNYTEIADLLGYNSVHYFSKDFKKTTGMSPSEYAKTIVARI